MPADSADSTPHFLIVMTSLRGFTGTIHEVAGQETVGEIHVPHRVYTWSSLKCYQRCLPLHSFADD